MSMRNRTFGQPLVPHHRHIYGILLLMVIVMTASSVVARTRTPLAPNTGVAMQVASDLPFPSWWSGECDSNNFRKGAGINAVPLGGSYRGVKACGPINYGVTTYFGNHGQLEWQCVELVARFMWLAYGTPGYKTNGKNVVNNYIASRGGTSLTKVPNGTAGRTPRPGDVMSFNTFSTTRVPSENGHTALVVSATVDANGNGRIRTLNQNITTFGDANHPSRQGYLDHEVRNWRVLNRLYANGNPADEPINWLTPQGNLPPNTPRQVSPMNGAVVNSRTVALHWEDTGDIDAGPRGFNDFFVDVGRIGEAPSIKLEWKRQTSFTFTVPNDGVYYWSVRAGDGGGDANNGASGWTPQWKFEVNTSPCSRKREGDADCNRKIDLMDFELFRQEFKAQTRGNRTTNRADFNTDGTVDIADFGLFRTGFINDQRAGNAGVKRAATDDTIVGETTAVYVDRTHYYIAGDGKVDIDVFMENNPQTQISSTDFSVQYDASVLAYDAGASTYVSPTCAGTNAALGYLNQIPSVTDDPATGTLRVSRWSTAETESLPYGKICAGTLRFNARSGIPIPSTTSIRLADSTQAADAAGPQAALVPDFDTARQVVNLFVGATPSIPALPRDANVEATTNSITLRWKDAALNEDGFEIYRWDAELAVWTLLNTVGPNITDYTDGELPSYTEQRYQIRGYNAEGTSEPVTVSGVTSLERMVFVPLSER